MSEKIEIRVEYSPYVEPAERKYDCMGCGRLCDVSICEEPDFTPYVCPTCLDGRRFGLPINDWFFTNFKEAYPLSIRVRELGFFVDRLSKEVA